MDPTASWLLTTDAYASLPVFLLYCLSVSYKLRKTGSWTRAETWHQPIASAFSVLVVNLGGHLLIAAGLRGDGWVAVLKSDVKVAVVLLCWTLIYFAPHDIFYRLIDEFAPFRLAVNLLNGWKRARDICAGISAATVLAPGSITVAFVYGVLSGWGGSLLFPYEAQTRGKTMHNDLRAPSLSFLTVVASAFVVALHFTGVLAPIVQTSDMQMRALVLAVTMWSVVFVDWAAWMDLLKFPAKPSLIVSSKKGKTTSSASSTAIESVPVDAAAEPRKRINKRKVASKNV